MGLFDPDRIPPELRFDIREFGTGVVPGVDCSQAIAAAIAAAVAVPDPALVYFPPGRWVVSPQMARTTSTTTITAQGHAIVVPAAGGVTLAGESRDVTAIDFRAYGGGSHESSWQTVAADGQVWRGGGIFLDGGTTAETASAPIVIRDLELNGGTSYTGNNTHPANPATGDGWDLTHKGVWLRNTAYFQSVRIERCEIHGFRGELVYAGANNRAQLQEVVGRDNLLHETNGDCWSVIGARVIFERNECHTAAAHGVEDNPFDKACTYADNLIHDTDLCGIWVYPGTLTGPFGRIDVSRNRIERAGTDGIRLDNPQGAHVHDNLVIDPSTGSAQSGIHVGARSGTNGPTSVRGVTVERNTVLADTQDVYIGIRAYDEGGAPSSRIIVRDNHAGLTDAGAGAGRTLTRAFDLAGITDPKAFLGNNTSRGSTYAASDSGSAREVLLTGTTEVEVVKRRPQQPGNWHVLVYFRVVTADTALTVTARWYDASGAQQSATMVTGTQTVGSHTVNPLVASAVGDTESQYVRLSAQAGTANRVYMTAQLVEIPTL